MKPTNPKQYRPVKANQVGKAAMKEAREIDRTAKMVRALIVAAAGEGIELTEKRARQVVREFKRSKEKKNPSPMAGSMELMRRHSLNYGGWIVYGNTTGHCIYNGTKKKK